MILRYIPNISNMVIRHVEKFLRALAKKFFSICQTDFEILWVDFWQEGFFQGLLKIFLRVVWPYSIYWEGRLIPYLYSRKRIRVIEHIDQKIFTKNQFSLKKTWFEPSSLDTTVGTLPSKFGKFLRKWTQNLKFEKLWGHIKKLTALLDLGKSPPQTVCQ